jgi:hypothetical protein
MFIFQPVMGRHMLLSDIQYGRFYLFQLTTGHSDQRDKQTRDAADYAKRHK